MAAVILAFAPEELVAYRMEFVDCPPDDPPSDQERAALALADRLRAEGER